MKNLRKLRKQQRLTMKEIARIVNVSESAISQHETGKREPDFATLKLLAEHFNTSTDYLLNRVEEAPSNVYEISNSIVDIGVNGERTVYRFENKHLNFVRMLLELIVRIQ